MIFPAIDKNKTFVAKHLNKGKIAVLPTETVYGLAADAANEKAIEKIFSLKKRPKFNPLIVHVSGLLMADRYVQICSIAKRLIESFWPGPLTLVLPLKKGGTFIHPLVTSGLSSLAVRNPQGFFSDVIETLGRAVVAPSANKSGKTSPTTAEAAANNFSKEEIPCIFDAGPCSIGIESTIIKILNGKLYLLRPGGITRSEIENVIGSQILSLDHDHATVEAPGMLQSHYAPKALLRLEANYVCAEEGLLAFGLERAQNFEHAKFILNLSPFGNTKEAAMHLFNYLQKFDVMNIRHVAVEPIPMQGLGEAINDRLLRAASPRFS